MMDGNQEKNSRDPPKIMVIDVEDPSPPSVPPEEQLTVRSVRLDPKFYIDKPDGSRRGSSVSLGSNKSKRQVFLEASAKLEKVRNKDGMKSLGQEIEHFVNITAMHGVKRVWEAKGWPKLFWLFVYVFLSVFLIWQMSKVIDNYNSRPIVSQVSFLMADQGLLFPKITICNYNPLKKSYMSSLNKTGDISPRLANYLVSANNDVLATYGHRPEYDLKADEEEFHIYKADHPLFTFRNFFEQGGYTCEDILKMCSFAGRVFNCCEYAYSVLTSLGRCQVLNLQEAPVEWMRKQSEGSEAAGLQFVLDANLDEQPEGLANPDPLRNAVLENGFRFYVDEPATWTYSSSQGISVSPGDVIYSALSANKFVLLDKDNWGNCSLKWPDGYTGYNTKLKYQEKDCTSKCKAKFFFDHCGCSPFVYNIDTEFPMCTPLETFHCVQNHIVKYHNESREEFVWPECRECVPECERWRYTPSNSYGRGFSRAAIKALVKESPEWTPERIRNNLLSVNVFFRDTTYTEYAQVTTTSFTDILSNMGGLMGLFLGMSVLTVIESVILFFKLSWLAMCRRRRQYQARKRRIRQKEDREAKQAIQVINNNALEEAVKGAVHGTKRRSLGAEVGQTIMEYDLQVPVEAVKRHNWKRPMGESHSARSSLRYKIKPKKS